MGASSQAGPRRAPPRPFQAFPGLSRPFEAFRGCEPEECTRHSVDEPGKGWKGLERAGKAWKGLGGACCDPACNLALMNEAALALSRHHLDTTGAQPQRVPVINVMEGACPPWTPRGRPAMQT